MKSIGNGVAYVSLGGLVLFIAFGVILPTSSQPRRTPRPMTQQLLYSVAAACTQYYWEHGEPPDSLASLTNNPKGLVLMYWGKSGTNDAWGHPIHFTPYHAALRYGTITSFGRDGRPGGEGLDADIEVRFRDNR